MHWGTCIGSIVKTRWNTLEVPETKLLRGLLGVYQGIVECLPDDFKPLLFALAPRSRKRAAAATTTAAAPLVDVGGAEAEVFPDSDRTKQGGGCNV